MVNDRFGTRLATRNKPTYFYVYMDVPLLKIVGDWFPFRLGSRRQTAMLKECFDSANWRRVFSPVWVMVAASTLSLEFPKSAVAEESVRVESRSICEFHPAAPIHGTLFICGGGPLPARVVDRFFEIAGSAKARIVIVMTASASANSPEAEARFSSWKQRPHLSLDFFHARNRLDADSPEYCRKLEDATALWFVGGNQNWIAETYLGTLAERLFHSVLDRGGVIGGTSAGAAIMTRTMIAGGCNEPVISTGFGFLPGAIVDQHFRKRNRFSRLKQALEFRPGHFGIGVDESTALIVSGRSLEVIGDSDVTVCLAESDDRAALETRIADGEKEDLIKLSRAAIARTQPRFAKNNRVPEVKKGTLVIVGGGAPPRKAVDEFLSAAGGKDAPIIVVCNESMGELPDDQDACGWLKEAGASNVEQLHAWERSDLTGSVAQDRLRKARGVWFTGHRQWALVDAYLDTPIQTLFQEVLRRGGVIGGTSAGASIQGEYLVHSNPPGTHDTVSEGYERGFGFLPGVAIEEKCADHCRFGELAELKKVHPHLVGIGIDNATALIVRGTTMEVVGENKVAVFDRERGGDGTQPGFELVNAGQTYDFKERRLTDHAAVESTPTK
jgi:cyanophycinase